MGNVNINFKICTKILRIVNVVITVMTSLNVCIQCDIFFNSALILTIIIP